jgi:hypothetical protein
MSDMQVIAVDWSGRAGIAQAEHIWVAQASRGRLMELCNGRTRAQVVEHLGAVGARGGRVVVGLDFAFSLPAWWLRRHGFGTAREAWRHLARGGAEELIAEPRWPFWGAGRSRAPALERRFRRTELRLHEEAGLAPKSVFQLAGPGAVGVGSLRGMPCLATLAERHGFHVWPFDPPGWPRAVEIYPRALTGRLDKGRFRCRRAHLRRHFVDQDPLLLERAAGSEDAFDAAVSALRMAEHVRELERLPPATDELERLEGRVWVPGL